MFLTNVRRLESKSINEIETMAQDQELENAQEKQENVENTTTEQDNAQTEQEETSSELAEIDRLTAELAEMKDKYTRLFAEFDNFRKRNAKERIDLVKNAGADVIREMLPVLDDLERAKAANENADDVNTVKEGFDLIQHKLKLTLEQKGLKPMDSKGEPFDTNFHEALTNMPAPSEDMKGKVIDVIEPGYFLNDTVLRYAKVVVGQ